MTTNKQMEKTLKELEKVQNVQCHVHVHVYTYMYMYIHCILPLYYHIVLCTLYMYI